MSSPLCCDSEFLQVNFSNRIISTVERGTIKRRVNFSDVMRFETDEGMKVTIFLSQGKELEFDADTLEEKNKVYMLLFLTLANTVLVST